MKLATLLTASCLFSASVLAATEPSLISAYKGSYSGTGSLSGLGMSVPATATASFQANRKKESGTLVITGIYSSMGASIALTHTLTFSKHGYTQVISGEGTALTSAGSAKIKAKVISFSGAGNSGSTSYSEAGSVKLTKKGLLVTDTIFVSGQSETFNYILKSHKKK